MHHKVFIFRQIYLYLLTGLQTHKSETENKFIVMNLIFLHNNENKAKYHNEFNRDRYKWSGGWLDTIKDDFWRKYRVILSPKYAGIDCCYDVSKIYIFKLYLEMLGGLETFFFKIKPHKMEDKTDCKYFHQIKFELYEMDIRFSIFCISSLVKFLFLWRISV